MNYYMPYSNITPYMNTIPNKTGLFSKLFKNGINWGTILSNTQKTLNIVNQTIPIVKQAGPVINNAKTMFKLMNEFKKIDTQSPIKETQNKNNIETQKPINLKQNYNTPTFFL